MTNKTVIYKYATGNPVEPNGSADVKDGIDNLQSFDVFMNAPEDTYNQRDGEIVRTVAGMNNEFDAHILNMGFTRIGTFAAGSTLTNPRQTLLWDVADGGDGQEYGWSGSFLPSGKVVPPGSTPLTTGGISVGAWISRFDPELRDYVINTTTATFKNEDGYSAVENMIAGRIGGVAGAVAHMVGNVYSTGGTIWELRSVSAQVVLSDFTPLCAINVRDFGAKGDGVNDDTIAIQTAINTASPFEWKGSVTATKDAMFNKPAASIILPRGVFRVTAPIALNPYVVMRGAGCGSFFNSRGNSCILGDFAGKDKFILDAAPYNASGVREFSAYGNADRFDSGQLVGVPGIVLEDFGIESANGTHRGALNLHAASITKVNRVSMTRACSGIQVSACWSGSVRDCFILARAVGAVFDYMTVFNFDTNYLSVSGTKPTSSEYQYPLYNPEIPADSITGVSVLGGYMQMQNNTIEGQEIGIHLRQVSGATVRSQYFEQISNYAFSVADCKAYLELARIDCPSAKIIKYRGTWVSDVCLDFHAHREGQQLSYDSIGEITNGKIQIKGLSTFLKGALELLPYIQQEPLLNTNGQLELFVNTASGNDSYNGQSPELPVKTLNALLPMVKAFINYPIVINISGVVDSFVESDNQARYPFLKNANITLQGNGTLHFTKTSTTNLHSLSMTDSKLLVRNLTVTAVDETLAGGYRALFQANGVCSVTLENVTIPAKQPIFGSSTNSSTNLSISMYGCNISTTSASIFMETDETYSGTVVWTEAGHGNSTTNRTVGGRPSDIKIGSTTFR